MSAAIPELQRLDPTELTALIAVIGQEMAAPVKQATIGDRLRVPIQGIVARATACREGVAGGRVGDVRRTKVDGGKD